MDYLEWLHSMSGMKFGLANIGKLMEALGNPQEKLRFIHIAGTNGKGSVTAMCASVLIAAGFKVGTYTSPHLVRYNERIMVDFAEITDSDLAKLAEKIYPYAIEFSCTYFEAATAIAIIYFLEKKVDFACLEVGMGGRLDSTNIIKPLLSVITTISLEHTQYLGDTIEKIATEKAGIIKEGIPVVTGTDGVALETISKIAAQKNAQLIRAGTCPYPTNLIGEFQKTNSAICLQIMKILVQEYDVSISEAAIKKGLINVKWPGRMDFVQKNILIDVAHNPHGMAALVNELKKMKFRRLIVVTGILKDKDYKTMLGELVPLTSKAIFCQPKTDRALSASQLATAFSRPEDEIVPDVVEAFEKGKTLLQTGDLLLVTGSLYTAGEVYAHIGQIGFD